MRNTLSARIHVGKEVAAPLSEQDLVERYWNVVSASLNLSHEWEKENAGKRYGTSIGFEDGYLVVTLTGWADER